MELADISGHGTERFATVTTSSKAANLRAQFIEARILSVRGGSRWSAEPEGRESAAQPFEQYLEARSTDIKLIATMRAFAP